MAKLGEGRRLTLGDVCQKGSSNIAQKDLIDNEGKYPIYGASGFIKNVDFYHQKKSYIAVVKDGAGIGRTMLLPANSSVIGTMQYLLPKENVDIDVKYLYYAIDSMNLAKYYSGTTIPHIYYKDYQKEPINLPCLAIQREIANVFMKIDQMIEWRNQQLQKLDELVKSRFVEMFGDPVTNTQGREVRPFKDFMLDIRYGTSQPPTFSEFGEFKFIRATNIKAGRITENDMLRISADEATKIKKCRLNGNEIIIVRSGANTGDTCVVTDEYCNQYAGYDIIITLNLEIANPVFFNELMNTHYMQAIIKPLTVRAAQPHINSEQVQNLPMLVVPLPEQERFAAFVRQSDKSKLAVQKSLEQLEILKKSLMQAYFG